jgi:hypothetical protein
MNAIKSRELRIGKIYTPFLITIVFGCIITFLLTFLLPLVTLSVRNVAQPISEKYNNIYDDESLFVPNVSIFKDGYSPYFNYLDNIQRGIKATYENPDKKIVFMFGSSDMEYLEMANLSKSFSNLEFFDVSTFGSDITIQMKKLSYIKNNVNPKSDIRYILDLKPNEFLDFKNDPLSETLLKLNGYKFDDTFYPSVKYDKNDSIVYLTKSAYLLQSINNNVGHIVSNSLYSFTILQKSYEESVVDGLKQGSLQNIAPQKIDIAPQKIDNDKYNSFKNFLTSDIKTKGLDGKVIIYFCPYSHLSINSNNVGVINYKDDLIPLLKENNIKFINDMDTNLEGQFLNEVHLSLAGAKKMVKVLAPQIEEMF